ncbi:hypothetical protein GGTG_05680 [Gaeumannomyces tritici R3-111a-1]|uniref:Uncharacterized protein n=1 Tax=Gaeumannomyces tritici (strain R3-111a-1) TaxID=644352 RepID=J3NWL8_GAET3|nr:hypothetical protein GGTG_05680 [Gaeumannomyces tritici R3-111a-1]EJT75750.1 hypothetical protein GGTG_05680 [Gaeumannomyces tritici R3-111a-1]
MGSTTITILDCICSSCASEDHRQWYNDRARERGGEEIPPPEKDLVCIRTGKVVVYGVKPNGK